ncbi:sigma-54-dependent Fis family transcriptional regulator [Thalassobacillus devorans]|uniref:Sigma-54-dependent Fis family transcriptional regulator n=1 Tax=Thalassobacillus devorans TaxID=279813 RepID=A0ABQ1PKT9_9BACI|nr:sigma 54-interacting transcriptional regulator [Thalassobacillus devorans]NIK30184.1 PAS domain S-box-containing protein [Thalassobacillus devorans]GGC98979.1 sigma-54-dependent Fis family transcriptional regulator [Thalassobacillus devorans]
MLDILEDYRDGILETIFGNVNHSIVVVDRNGFVSYMNDSYCDFLEVNKEGVRGKHVTDVIENTRMHIVAETGKEELADLQYIRGNYMIAHRIPLRADGEVVGALGMVLFRDTEEWLKLNSHIKDLFLELETYRNQMKKLNGVSYSLHDIISNSSEMHILKDKIKKVAPGDVSVLLRGESGTGKELFAHSIHHLSERNTKPFVKVNCAAIPADLLESELFGYQEGAFTGAKKGGKPGKFQMADGGTLFLDEIGDMPLQAQVKILRVLQEGEVEAIGSVNPQKVDVRIIAATNQPLEELIAQQKFREDLFYRINVVQIDIPPLRKRPEDLRVLAKYLLEKVTERIGKRVVDFEPHVYDCFLEYHWPGNVRELENVIEAAVHLTSNEMVELDDLPDHIKPDALLVDEDRSLKAIMETAERQAIERTLKKVHGDKGKAAVMLGIGKSSLYDKVKKYNL